MNAQEKAHLENTYGKEGDNADLRQHLNETAEDYLQRLRAKFKIPTGLTKTETRKAAFNMNAHLSRPTE